MASSCGKNLKRKSPSQIRREDRRREARKSKITEEVVKDPAVTAPQTPKAAEKTAVLSFKCEQCEYTSTSEKGLKQHVRMKHKQVVEEAEESSEKPTCPGARHVCGPCGCTVWGTPCMYYTPDFMRQDSVKQ